jgi:hypothetical protein
MSKGFGMRKWRKAVSRKAGSLFGLFMVGILALAGTATAGLTIGDLDRDVITGTPEADSISWLGGNDTISSLSITSCPAKAAERGVAS